MGKTKKGKRKEIVDSVNRIKCTVYLDMILKICELFRKSMDDKECLELSDIQWNKRSLIIEVLEREDAEEIEGIGAFARQYRLAGGNR